MSARLDVCEFREDLRALTLRAAALGLAIAAFASPLLIAVLHLMPIAQRPSLVVIVGLPAAAIAGVFWLAFRRRAVAVAGSRIRLRSSIGPPDNVDLRAATVRLLVRSRVDFPRDAKDITIEYAVDGRPRRFRMRAMRGVDADRLAAVLEAGGSAGGYR